MTRPPPSGVPSTTNTPAHDLCVGPGTQLKYGCRLSPVNGSSLDYSARPLNGGIIEIQPYSTTFKTDVIALSKATRFTPYALDRNWWFAVAQHSKQQCILRCPQAILFWRNQGLIYMRGVTHCAIPVSTMGYWIGYNTEWGDNIPQTTDDFPAVLMWLSDLDITQLNLDRVLGGIGVELGDNGGRVSVTSGAVMVARRRRRESTRVT